MDSIKTVIIWIGAEVAIEVMKSRVVGAYVLGVEIEPPAGVDWVPRLCLGAWWFSRLEAKNRDMVGGETVNAWSCGCPWFLGFPM